MYTLKQKWTVNTHLLSYVHISNGFGLIFVVFSLFTYTLCKYFLLLCLCLPFCLSLCLTLSLSFSLAHTYMYTYILISILFKVIESINCTHLSLYVEGFFLSYCVDKFAYACVWECECEWVSVHALFNVGLNLWTIHIHITESWST